MAFADEDTPEVVKWLGQALIESLALNIELIGMITDCASPELRKGAAFQVVVGRVRQLEEHRRFLQGEVTQWQ